MKKRTILGLGAMVVVAALCVALAVWSGQPKGGGAGIYTPGTYTSTQQGFLGPVTVKVTVDANKITNVDIDAPDETPTLGGEAAKTMAAAALEANSAEVDGVAGATYTSNAVKAGLADCLAQAKAGGAAGGIYTPGTYEASAQGCLSAVKVTVTVDESKITDVDIDASGETPELGGKAAETLAQAILDANSADVDSVTGSTMTSEAVKTAVADCLAQARGEKAPEAEGMKAGTYNTVCKGYYGDFDLSVTVSETAITDITYGENTETIGVGKLAIDMMIDRILAANTSGVDTVSGATMTSTAVRNAVADCLQQAGAPEALTADAPAPEKSAHTLTADVVVVGGGGSGMAAAIAAKEAGANVILLEKQDILGGTTLVSAGIVYGALSDEDVPGMVDYYMQRAEGNADREMLTFYAQHSMETLDWLQSLGTQIMFTAPAGTAPEARARFTMLPDGTNFIGYTLTHPMEEKCKELGVEIHTGVKATELIQNADGAIVGVKGEGKDGTYTVNAKAVILCAGGYDASSEMKAEYSPNYTNDFPLSNKGNVGDGIRMGMAVGADTVFKGGIIGFTCLNATLPQSGYNALAFASVAFAAADGTYLAPNVDYPISHTLVKTQPDNFMYGLLDGAGAESGEAAIALGYGFKGDTVADLAAASGADAAKLTDAFAQANLSEGPFYLIKVSPTSIGSMGGLKVNTNSQVLKDGQPIAGLYAAGETANGDFYYQEYPASGSSNCISITFGLQAGRQAAAAVLGTGTQAPVESTAPVETPAPANTPAPASTPEPTPAPAAGIYKPGTYTATAMGMGDLTVTVTVDDNNIVSVTIDAPNETPSIGGAALPTLQANAMAQGTAMDGVTNATITSDAVRDALTDALAQAKR